MWGVINFVKFYTSFTCIHQQLQAKFWKHISMCSFSHVFLNKFYMALPGRVGVEPQVRGSEEHPGVVFSMATNFRYKKGEEYTTSTDWHNVAVFKPSLRESVNQNVSKGENQRPSS